MERIEGPTMLEAFGARPWKIRGWARMLADLHLRLEAIPTTDLELPQRDGIAETIVHGDLHPDNVMLGERGPVVIDWPNALLGPAGVDAANTWLLVATADIEGGSALLQTWGRGYFVRRFVAHCGTDRLRANLAAAAEHKLVDANLRPREAEAIRALVRAQTGPRYGR
jgi:aminoglycoside phosphotransferase (APT) family kinase protein